jgi:hypothetical protein
MYVDSNKKELNSGQIIAAWMEEGHDSSLPPQVMMAGILRELSMPNVKTKQFGNTLFEVILGQGNEAFFKAFNADTAPNFIENSKNFCVWARHSLGLKTLVTQFSGVAIEKLFKAISMDPPMPGMGYQVMRMQSGETRIVLNLGA